MRIDGDVNTPCIHLPIALNVHSRYARAMLCTLRAIQKVFLCFQCV